MTLTYVERKEKPFFGRDWVDVAELTRAELEYFLENAEAMRTALADGVVSRYRLAEGLDLMAALLFYEPSTRTRSSFEIAAKRLGMHTVNLGGPEASSVSKGESLTDTVDMFHSYNLDAVIMRHHLDGSAKAVVEHLRQQGGKVLPVLNGGDGKNKHPTQALLDTFTIRQCCGRLHELQIGIAVDARFGRTTHDLPIPLMHYPGNVFHIFTHELLKMPRAVLKLLATHGVEFHEYCESGDQLRELLPQLDFLYMTRPQKERFADISEYYKARDLFRFMPEMMEGTKSSFGLGHPLPDNKEHPSIHPAVHQHPKYWAKRQAGNGVPTRLVELALSLGLLGDQFRGERYRPAAISDRFYAERAPKPRGERAEELQIRPIRNGTVIDHVENNPYAINTIARILGVAERQNVYRQGVVRPLKRPEVIKGVLMIEDRYLADDEARQVAAIAPGSTVNDIRDGNVVLKRDLLSPQVLDGLPFLKCTNTGCITYPAHMEHIVPKLVRVGNDRSGLYKCSYCNTLMESHEMF